MVKNKKRWISILLCFAMLFGILPVNAFADTTTTTASSPADQIGKYYKANDTTGILESSPTLNPNQITKSYENGMVTTKKTITALENANENEFNIELEVNTQAKIEQIHYTEDAAAVIVIDTSGSMKNDRLKTAKDAATKFIQKFAVADSTAKRKIAVVTFSGDNTGWSYAANTKISWKDASNFKSDDLELPKNGNGGTCLEAGLILAKNLLNDSTVSSIANKNIIILTDGKPTFYLNETAKQDTSKTKIGAASNVLSNGMDADGFTHALHESTEATSNNIIQSGINIYGVYVGNEYVKCPNTGYKNCNLNKSAGQWLREDCGMVTYSINSWNDKNNNVIENTFGSIVDEINFRAKAWKTEDPLDDMVDFVEFNMQPTDPNAYFYNENDKKIVWDLRYVSPISTTTDNKGVTTYTYKLNYQVKLNTLNEDYEAEKFYPTNGVTSVRYWIESASDKGVSEISHGIAYFNVPSVKGYDADKTFTKVDEFGNALPGATFTLTTDDKEGWSKTATSDANGKVEFKDIPSGHTYTVTETTAPANYNKDGEPYSLEVAYGQATGTIGENDTTKGDVVKNTIKKGDLKISKTVTGTTTEQAFTFTVNLTNASGLPSSFQTDRNNGTLTLDNNKNLTFELKGGESLTIHGIPVGTNYTVTETSVANYTEKATGASGKISETMAVAAFTNHYSEPEPDKGQLQITKIVEGITTGQVFTFTVTLQDKDGQNVSGKYDGKVFASGDTITLKSGDIATISDIPVGTRYTVTEAADNNYDTTWSNEKGTITKDATAEVTCTNTIKTDSLTVSKTVAGTGANTNEEFTFEVEVTLPNGEAFTGTHDDVIFNNSGEATITLKAGESKKITGIPVGSTYEVTETANDAYTTIKSGDTGTIAVGGKATAAFTNTLKTSSLTVKKVVTGDTAPASDAFKFDVEVTMPNGKAFTGTHDEVTFNNSGKATITLKAGKSKEITGIPVGSMYKVTEQTPDTAYTPSYDNAQEGTISVNGVTTTVTNTYTTPENEFNFTIKKVVEKTGDIAPNGEKTFNFVVSTSNDKNNENAVLNVHPTITVNGIGTELTRVSVKTTSSSIYIWEVAGNETGWTYDSDIETITKDSNTTEVTFKNSYYEKKEIEPEYGNLFVEKSVVDPNHEITTPQEFKFTITAKGLAKQSFDAEGVQTKVLFDEDGKYLFWLEDGEILQIFGIPAGTEYKVTEADYSDQYTTSSTNSEGTIEADNSVSVLFVNTWKTTTPSTVTTTPGSLMISKTVKATDDKKIDTEKAFTFTLTLRDKDDTLINDTFNGKQFENGAYTFSLRHGETLTITGIPAGTTYAVTEDPDSAYTTTSTGETGTIPANEIAVAAFTNTFIENDDDGGGGNSSVDSYGKITIRKTVTGDNAPAEDIAYAFTAWVRNSNGNAVSEKVSYKIVKADGTIAERGNLTIDKDGYRFYLKDGESITFGNITSGRRVAVQEITTGDFTTTSTGLTDGVCMISANRTKTVEFVNDYSNTETPIDPEEPKDPIDPTEPTQPATPAAPEEPTPSDTSFDDVPKTGDETGIGLWIAIACLTLSGMVALAFGRKRFGTR